MNWADRAYLELWIDISGSGLAPRCLCRPSMAPCRPPSAAQDVTTEVLKSTLSIPPTVRKENGDRIQILVARDVDFTSVYELRRAPRQP